MIMNQNQMMKNKLIWLRMTDGYGIATNYEVKPECPYDQTELVDIRADAGCYDGEWTYVNRFTCEKKCLILYKDIIEYNGLKR